MLTDLHGKTDPDNHTSVVHLCQKPVVPAAPLAEAFSGGGKGQPGHQHQIHSCCVRILLRHHHYEASATAPVPEGRQVRFSRHGVKDHDASQIWALPHLKALHSRNDLRGAIRLIGDGPTPGAHLTTQIHFGRVRYVHGRAAYSHDDE